MCMCICICIPCTFVNLKLSLEPRVSNFKKLQGDRRPGLPPPNLAYYTVVGLRG